MKIVQINTLEKEIDSTLELTAICRGEWCRALEAKVDVLEDELVDVSKWCTVDTGCVAREGARISEMSHKIMKSYNNLRGDFRL
jgi:hypothetical protein